MTINTRLIHVINTVLRQGGFRIKALPVGSFAAFSGRRCVPKTLWIMPSCYGVVPVIDLEKIDWNSVTDTKSLFESVLDMLKSKDEESI